MVVLGQYGSIWASSFYLGKLVLFGQMEVVFVERLLYLGNMVRIGEIYSIFVNWFHLGKGGCIWAKFFYLDKLVQFGEIGILFGQKWLYLGKMCFLGKLVQFGH